MHVTRPLTLALLLVFALSACRAIPPGLLDGGGEPAVEAEPTPVTKTLCESSADLRTDVEFLRTVEVSEDGLLQLIVAIDAALGEARTLALLVGEEYGPLVSDVVVSLQGLRDVAEEVEEQETIGAGIATIGEAITSVGESMDALEVELRDPCPEEQP